MVIKPLTIVIGKNSSGKSAFSRLPLLLANSFLPESEEPITVNYNGIEFGGSFKDLIYNKLPHGSLKMTLSFSDETIICFEVQNINGTPIQMINKWSIESTNINISFEIVLTEDNIISSRDTEYTANGKSYLVTFQGLVPINIEFPDKEYDSRDIELLKESLYNFSRNVEYIGPYRQIPQRVYFHSGRSPSKLGVKGENAPQILGSASFRNKDLVSNVGDWYEKYLGGWRIEVEHVGEFFQVVLVSPDDSSVKVNIVDVGQGMSQILPLVVQCLTRTKVSNAISIIEQPELHLHPAAHGDLAELFAKSAMADGGRYILETHSENIILRIRRLIVQGILSSKDVIIYWIDDGNRPGSQVREIQIDEDGELSDWPKGVFSEDYEEVLAIREAQKTKNADTDKS
jgi:predicted ATPase